MAKTFDEVVYSLCKTYTDQSQLGFKSVKQVANGFEIEYVNGIKATYTVQNMHKHTNMSILNVLNKDADGDLTFNGKKITNLTADQEMLLMKFSLSADNKLLFDGKEIAPDFLDTTGDGTKFLADDGTYKVVAGGTGGASDSSNVSYDNSIDASISSVKEALDKLYSKVYYVAPQISSFTTTPAAGNYELGQTIPSIIFNWTYNKDIASQSLTGCVVVLSDRTATYDTPLTSNKTFTLTASDGEKSVSSNKAFTFTNKVWYGSASEGIYDDSFILGLSTGKLQTSKAGTYTVNVGNNEYFFIALPTSYNNSDEITGKIGGFETSFNKVATINHTNASGYATNYNIYKSGNHSLGSVTFII